MISLIAKSANEILFSAVISLHSRIPKASHGKVTVVSVDGVRPTSIDKWITSRWERNSQFIACNDTLAQEKGGKNDYRWKQLDSAHTRVVQIHLHTTGSSTPTIVIMAFFRSIPTAKLQDRFAKPFG